MLNMIKSLIPALVLGIILSVSFLIPNKQELLPSSMSMTLPLNFELQGWYGIRRQESSDERKTLAPDTLFTKADYRVLRHFEWEKQMPDIHVSLVFSGSDMNQSIHRPELCLPGQGHLNLTGTPSEILLDNGKEIRFTRLSSFKKMPNLPDGKLHFIHYYTFVGHGNLCYSHMLRTLCDIKDRTLRGISQRWAYFQVGIYWSPHLGISQEEADRLLRKLISQLLPGIINWDEIGS